MPEQEQTLTIQQAIDLAIQHHTAGRLSQAETIYQKILQANPDQPIALHLLGVIAHQIGKNDVAVDLITKALNLRPDFAEAHNNLGLTLQGMGKLDEAVASYREALGIQPDFAEAHSNLGDTLGELGRLDEAVTHCKKAINIKPDYAEAHNNLGNALQELGKLEEAEASYGKALAIKPDYADAHSNLGVALKDLGKLEEAVASHQNALRIKPDYAEAHNNLGLALWVLGRLEEAVASYRKALAIKPNYAEAHGNLGVSLQDLGKLEDAVASYRKALAIKPNYAGAHNNLGNALQELGRLEEAIAGYHNALAIKPDFAEAHNNLGIALSCLGRWSDSLEHYQKVHDLMPTFPLLHSNLGYAFNALKRREEALYHFAENMRLNTAKKQTYVFDKSNSFIYKPKIQHDIEQFNYLGSLNTDKSRRFNKLANIYTALNEEIDWAKGDGYSAQLTKTQQLRIQDTHLIPINLDPPNSVPNSTLNSRLDIQKIVASYKENAPALVVVDDLLNADVLCTLQKFLLESTIWFYLQQNGYIGAYLDDGLSCPLLLQITEDLHRTFPAIFEDHQLKRLWAYKYDSQRNGINLHADDAAVNVNFWVTPRSANLDPKTGGLIIYDAAAPQDWAYDVNYTGEDTAHIHKYLEEKNSKKIIIPYAENRAAIFNSSLFHETDTFRFKAGYVNRRINITMLFGGRKARRLTKSQPIPKSS